MKPSGLPEGSAATRLRTHAKARPPSAAAPLQSVPRSEKLRGRPNPTTDDILDSVEEGRARRSKQYLLIIGVELPNCETAPSRKPAQCVGETVRQAPKGYRT